MNDKVHNLRIKKIEVSEKTNETNINSKSIEQTKTETNVNVNNNNNLVDDNLYNSDDSYSNACSSEFDREENSDTKKGPLNLIMLLNVDTVLKIVPEFNGSPDKLHKFITCAEIIYKPLISNEDKISFLELLKTKLSGRAYDVVKYKDFDDWNQLKQELSKQFTETRSIEQLQVQLVGMTQRDDDVRTFANRVECLLSDLNDVCISREGIAAAIYIQNLNATTALNTFQDGLRYPIGLLVQTCRFSKL